MIVVLPAGVGINFRIDGSEIVAKCITMIELKSFF